MHTETPLPAALRGFPELATVPESARLGRCSRATVYRLIQDGKLRAVRVGRLVRVDVASLRELLNGGE